MLPACARALLGFQNLYAPPPRSNACRQVLHKFLVDLPKKHGRGGQSALRFARLRMEKRHNYVRKVGGWVGRMWACVRVCACVCVCVGGGGGGCGCRTGIAGGRVLSGAGWNDWATRVRTQHVRPCNWASKYVCVWGGGVLVEGRARSNELQTA